MEKYKWTEELEAFCLTLAVGAQRAEVERAFKIVPESRKLTTVAQYWETFGQDSQGGNDTVQIDTISGSIVAFESNGWTGADHYELKTFSLIKCRVYVSIFRNINASTSFVLARDGQLVRQFDPLLYEADGAVVEENAYAWGLEHPIPSAFVLAEKLTGVSVTRDWLLGQAHPTYRTLHGNP